MSVGGGVSGPALSISPSGHGGWSRGVGDQQRGVGTAAAEAQPHQREVQEEKMLENRIRHQAKVMATA
jgi:hypothetical protein